MIYLLLLLALACAGCDTRTPTFRSPLSPSLPQTGSPSPPATPATTLRVFTEPGSNFSTTDLRDAQEQIVQINTAGELIWTADGTHLPGYTVVQGVYIPADACSGWMEVRFGTRDAQRRAYLTVDYGHDNPGTVIDLELRGGALTCSRTDVYPPGTYALSGVVTEMTPTAPVPVEGAVVHFSYGSGWRGVRTGKLGFYRLAGLYDREDDVVAIKTGYQTRTTRVSVHGDTRFDIELVRQ